MFGETEEHRGPCPSRSSMSDWYVARGGVGVTIGSLGIQEITRCLSDGKRLMAPTETAIRED